MFTQRKWANFNLIRVPSVRHYYQCCLWHCSESANGFQTHATKSSDNHAEISVWYKPRQYRQILEFFFQIHDPSTRNRQGNDVGTSYRSAIFYTSDEQRRIAEDTIADVGFRPVARKGCY